MKSPLPAIAAAIVPWSLTAAATAIVKPAWRLNADAP
jgi:hypothetical protein